MMLAVMVARAVNAGCRGWNPSKEHRRGGDQQEREDLDGRPVAGPIETLTPSAGGNLHTQLVGVSGGRPE